MAVQTRLERAAVKLTFLSLTSYLSVSSNLLTWLGIPYVSDGGNTLFKLHPATYMLLAATIVLLPSRHVTAFFSGCKLLSLYVFCMIFSVLYLAALTGSGNLVVILDTFLPAGLCALVLSRATRQQILALRRLLQALLITNAILALIEMTTHQTLVPLFLNNSAYSPHIEDFRPTALFDHPLTGSLMAIVGLALAPASRLRRLYNITMWAALFSFGGRAGMFSATATTLVTGVVFNGRLLLCRAPRSSRVLVASALTLLAAVAATAVAVHAGLGSRVVRHLYWDSSAQVRVAQWQILAHLDSFQLLFGTRREDLLALLTPLWLGPGVEVIENFWLLMFANFGAFGFLIFLLGFGSFLLWCWKHTSLQGKLLVCTVVLVASTSNSLGRKSSILVCLVAAISCLSKNRSVDPRYTPLTNTARRAVYGVSA